MTSTSLNGRFLLQAIQDMPNCLGIYEASVPIGMLYIHAMSNSPIDDAYDYNKNGAGKLVGVSVGQLKQILAKYEDDTLVVIQKDPEGNGYSPLAFAGADWYVATNTWSGEAYSQEDIDADEIDLTHEDPDTYDKVLFLGPIN